MALLPLQAMAQEAEGTTGKCRVNPDAADTVPLAEKLDDCNGVLRPPKVGDSEIVEPAPDVGETPVIRPGEIEPQEDQDSTGSAPSSFSISELVDAIGNADATARRLGESTTGSVEIQDITPLMAGANAASINTALAQHQSALANLKARIQESGPLSEALDREGVHIDRVVTALEEAGAVTIFVK
ncbi:MAG: hypothetical protein KF810_01915 [Rhizobiaceae bacterium]|nr:hypothetical protein [Rhizobiaceae bacterium]